MTKQRSSDFTHEICWVNSVQRFFPSSTVLPPQIWECLPHLRDPLSRPWPLDLRPEARGTRLWELFHVFAGCDLDFEHLVLFLSKWRQQHPMMKWWSVLLFNDEMMKYETLFNDEMMKWWNENDEQHSFHDEMMKWRNDEMMKCSSFNDEMGLHYNEMLLFLFWRMK